MSDHLPPPAAPESDSTNLGPGRREFLTAGSVFAVSALAASGREADPPVEAPRDRNGSNPGPENRALADLNPSSFRPPATDHGDVPNFWQSFSLAHRRIQSGGWTRQVNVKDFPISTEIAGVNMRLTAGGVRELHWHAASEWGLLLTGAARLTAIDDEGRSYVNDVAAGDLWFFPAGIPHSIQGLGPDGCEFVLVFDDGNFSEFNTTLLSDWIAHTPRSVLAKNWGVPEAALAGMPCEELYIFQAPVPGPLAVDQRAAAGTKGRSPVAFDFKLSDMPPTVKNRSGEVRVVDARNFPVATTVAAAHVILKPGGLRELHWHPHADEWQYYLRGQGRMTLFMNGGKARTMDFRANDIGYVPRTMGHYIENTGDTDLVFVETFRASRYRDFSLSDWLAHTPPELVLQHLRLGKDTLAAIPTEKPVVVPR